MDKDITIWKSGVTVMCVSDANNRGGSRAVERELWAANLKCKACARDSVPGGTRACKIISIFGFFFGLLSTIYFSAVQWSLTTMEGTSRLLNVLFS